MSKRVFIVALLDEIDRNTTILGYPVIFSGVGKINATMAAYKAFNDGYDEVINIGSCGSLKLKAGDIVKVGTVYQDIDCTPLCEYGSTLNDSIGNQIILDRKKYTNTCFTTDYFFDIQQRSKYSNNYLDMVIKSTIFDMECFAIAKVCKRFDIGFSSYKWVSDDGDASHWKDNCKIGFEKVKKLLDEQFKER